MAGWFEAFANFNRGAAPAVDRFQQWRQLDENNQFKIQQQRFEESLANQKMDLARQQQMNDDLETKKKMDLLDMTILGQKQKNFESMHSINQSLTPEEYTQGKSIGMPVYQQKQETGLQSLMGNLGGFSQNSPMFNNAAPEFQSPTESLYRGTPAQQQSALEQARQNMIMKAMMQISQGGGGQQQGGAMPGRGQGMIDALRPLIVAGQATGIKGLTQPPNAPAQQRPPVNPLAGKITQDAQGRPVYLDENGQPTTTSAYIKPTSTGGAGDVSDTKRNATDTAASILRGEGNPLVLSGSGYTKEKSALLGEVSRQSKALGVSPAKLVLEFQAAQRAVSSMNGPQPQRLRAAIAKTIPSLDMVDTLSDNLDKIMKKTKSPFINKGVMMAAQQGAYGQEAQVAANNLSLQIADVTGEIAQVIMGGYAPTDHGLELAAKNLAGEWTVPMLKASIAQARRNIGFAAQAMNEIPVAGTNENVYATGLGLPSAGPQGTSAIPAGRGQGAGPAQGPATHAPAAPAAGKFVLINGVYTWVPAGGGQ